MGRRRGAEGRPTKAPPRPNSNKPAAGLTPFADVERKGYRAVALHINDAKRFTWGRRIAAALGGHAWADVIVYDAEGKPVAIIDPQTKERRPYTPPA